MAGKGGTSDVKRYSTLSGVDDSDPHFTIYLAVYRSSRLTHYAASIASFHSQII